MYPFKAWDGPAAEGDQWDAYFSVATLNFVAVDPTVASTSRQTPYQTGGDGHFDDNVAKQGVNEIGECTEESEGEKDAGYEKDKGAEAWTASSLGSDDTEMVPGTPGEDAETEEAWMMKSYRKRLARMGQEVVLR